MATFNCRMCGAEYNAKPSAERKFCSPACTGRHFSEARRGQEIVVPGTPFYSAAQLELMRREANAGKTARQITAMLPGRTLGAVTQQIVRLRKAGEIPAFDGAKSTWMRGGDKPASTPEQRARVQELALSTALSWVMIGAEVGLSHHQVRRIIAAMPQKREKPLSPKAAEYRERRAKAAAKRAPILDVSAPPVAPPPPKANLIAGCIPVGLHRAWQWWQEQGRTGRPDIREINALRRQMKRIPFTIIGGKFTGGAAA